ncbi:glycosyltransferase [Neobacillus sp. PS3-40]|uniref:glycosyltransferase n=1 Tax=Neobacillus sp. PS3-40 TaxID=3070679 RepID=UPI0027DF8BBD|nr:glycosyltransferase [Neobacillus sp. PS3-40]WML45809.1 glycosyltransferase [Neobacillus sp. PS3-40]
MKKILFMITNMNIGGVEKSLLSLLSVIPKDKYDITLLLLEKRGALLEYIPDWVKIEEANWFEKVKPIMMQPPQKTIKSYLRNKMYAKTHSFLSAYLISKHFDCRYSYYKHILKEVPVNLNQYDIAISYQGPTDVIDYYIANKVIARKKISWVHFDVSHHYMNKRLHERIYKKFDKILIVSEEAKKRLIEKIPGIRSKSSVFQNIIEIDSIKEMSKKKVDFDSDFEGIKIVTVGRLAKEKGQDLAINVLYKLRKEGYLVKWYCIGEGKQRKEYEYLIDKYNLKHDFILLGSRTNPYPFIAKSDIYVQTSRHEGFCLTLAEAKCLCKPIVTTNFIGAFEQIEDGITGFIVGCSEEELFERVKFLIDNKKVRDNLSENLSKNQVNQKLLNFSKI